MKFKVFSIIIASAILFASCGNKEETVNENSVTSVVSEETAEGDESGYPVTVEHAFGESVIESKPERVATVGWGNQDVALALGVVPIGMPKANWGSVDENGLLPWQKEKIEELGGEIPTMYDETDGISFESVANITPDVIIGASSGLTQEDYDLLTAIAPTIAYSENPWTTLWREQVELNSKGMGMEQEGIELIKQTEDLIAEKVSAHPEFEGKTSMFAWIDVTDMSSFSVYTPHDARAAFLTDLGFIFPENVSALAENTDAFYIDISAENAPKLTDVDTMVLYGDESMLPTLQADPLLGTIPAIKNGAIVFLEDGSDITGASTQTVLSIPYTIDEYIEKFAEAVSKINE